MNIEGLLLKHSPILACLIGYLAPLDWICLVRTFPSIIKHFLYQETLNTITKTCLFNNLKHYFHHHQVPVAQFIMDNLNERYAITGGFLLATITGDSHFMQGDLDIIHVIDENVTEPLMQEKLMDHGLVETGPSTNYPCNLVSNLSFVIDYELQERQFQLLYVKDKNAYVRGFDLDFCKSYYNSINGLVIFALDSIIYKKCRINLEAAHFQTYIPILISVKAKVVEARIAKYRDRGYTICIEAGMSDIELCADMKTRNKDRENLEKVAKKWNLFWANKR
jgi:hypothetical protein